MQREGGMEGEQDAVLGGRESDMRAGQTSVGVVGRCNSVFC
jgi:hypothetical protein